MALVTAEQIRKAAANGTCVHCGIRPATRIKRCTKCYEYHRKAESNYKKTRKERQQELKLEVFQAYGGPWCACCGVANMEFLSLDHIKGGGNQHRKKVGSRLYFYLKRDGFPEGYRVLCMNCNFAIGKFGYCPHKGGV